MANENEKKVNRVILKHSFVKDKAPSAETMQFGELAVNCNEESPFLSTLVGNGAGDTSIAMVKFSSDDALTATFDNRYASGSDITDLHGVINNKADKTHSHSASDITGSTKLSMSVIPTGTTNTTVAVGNHNHDANYAPISGITAINSQIETINTTIEENEEVISGALNTLNEALDSKADVEHTHDDYATAAFSTVSVNGTSIAAENVTDTLTVVTGDTFIKITGDATNDKITFGINTGTTSTTVARGDHSHVSNDITDTITIGTSITSASTQLTEGKAVYEFVNTQVDAKLAANDAMLYKGTLNTDSTLPSTANAGWTYKMAQQGTFYGQKVEVGDMVLCNRNYSNLTILSSNFETYYNIIETNHDGCVSGPSSAVTNNFAAFDSTTGKVIRDSGYNSNSFKTKQNAITDPLVEGSGTTFIATISQDANGVITATKKNVQFPTVATASTSAYGVTKLSSAIDSTSTTLAATPSAVKSAYDLANSKWTKVDGSTSAAGIVQLNDSINSTSTSQAATANAVKKVYDLADGKAAGTHGHGTIWGKDLSGTSGISGDMSSVGNITPSGDNIYEIGSSSLKFKKINLSESANIGNSSISYNATTGCLEIIA